MHFDLNLLWIVNDRLTGHTDFERREEEGDDDQAGGGAETLHVLRQALVNIVQGRRHVGAEKGRALREEECNGEEDKR